MKAILTGHRGFIGNRLLTRLNELGIYTYLVEAEDSYESMESMVKQCDVIFHVGAISDTTLQDCNKMLYFNYTLSKIIFDLARKYDKKVVYSSSAANYGDGDGIPNNIYGWSKKLAEEYGLKACEKFVALRYFNVYGPGEEHKGKMASVAYQAWKAGKFKLFPGKIARDFVYVDDVVEANIIASKLDRGLFDVGTGTAESFQSVMEGMNIEFEYHDPKMIPNWYQYHTCANVNLRLPGWTPKYDIKLGTKNYLEYLS